MPTSGSGDALWSWCASSSAVRYSSTSANLTGGGASHSTVGYGLSSWSSDQCGEPPELGATGLRNLGNTCFMNSIVQCLVHAMPLRRFFDDHSWRSQINPSNILGAHGELAEAFADLLGRYCSRDDLVGRNRFRLYLRYV